MVSDSYTIPEVLFILDSFEGVMEDLVRKTKDDNFKTQLFMHIVYPLRKFVKERKKDYPEIFDYEILLEELNKMNKNIIKEVKK